MHAGGSLASCAGRSLVICGQGFEQFDQVAGRVLDEDLPDSRTGDDVGAEAGALAAQRKRRPLRSGQPGQGHMRGLDVQVFFPRIACFLGECRYGGQAALISLIFMITRRDHKAIHDLVAGTVVLYDPDKVLAR
jgi:hypothetical protein